LEHREDIQNSASILAININSIIEHISKNSDMLNKTVVYPSTNYPGRTQEGLLGQLLRKKLEPEIETRVEEGRTIEKAVEESKEDVEDLWNWAQDWIGERIGRYAAEEAGEEYTEEEKAMGIENVNTGLRRTSEDEESEEEDEDEEMEDVGVGVTSVRRTSVGQVEFDMTQIKKVAGEKSRTAEDILRFSTSGTAPPGGNR
jgi:mediator of RNA polymerase II transcription subunit 8